MIDYVIASAMLMTTPILHWLTRVKPIGESLEYERWTPPSGSKLDLR